MKILALLLITTSITLGQNNSKKYIHRSVDFIYGQKILSQRTFGGGLNDMEKINWGTPIAFIGIGTTERLNFVRELGSYDANFYYTQIIPQKLKVNDSITTNITGFNFAFTFLGFDAFSNKKDFDLIFSLGVNTGRLRLYGNSYTRQKNPYFSPKISMIPRLTIGKINIALNIAYEFDLSKKNWRRTFFSNSPKIELPQTSNTGLTVLASIGYILKEH